MRGQLRRVLVAFVVSLWAGLAEEGAGAAGYQLKQDQEVSGVRRVVYMRRRYT